MIKEITIYTVICDNCGVDSNANGEYMGWNDLEYAESLASEDDWIKDIDKHYCNDCYNYDDEDNLIINKG